MECVGKLRFGSYYFAEINCIPEISLDEFLFETIEDEI